MALLLIVGGIGLLGTYVVPTLLGFGSTGIVAGSVAAGIQSGIGNVAAGSAFSTLTSMGMTGTFAQIGGTSIGAFVTGLLMPNNRNNQNEQNEQHEQNNQNERNNQNEQHEHRN